MPLAVNAASGLDATVTGGVVDGLDPEARAVLIDIRAHLVRSGSAEASATSASQRGADAGQDGEGWPNAQAFWGSG